MNLKRSVTLRRTKKLLLTVLLIILTLLVFASIVYSPRLVLRAIVWGESDVYDYQHLYERQLEASDHPFHFTEAYNDAQVRSLFERNNHIDALEQFLELTETQAFIVIQNDCILYEHYFNGLQRESIVTTFSVAKSFDSALIGIAIEEGLIASVNDPITDYIPELLERDSRFAEITIRDLLLMSSGLRYAEYLPYADDVRTYAHYDLRSQALEQTEIVASPGQSFLYNNYNPLLLGMIIERVAGMSVTQYLQERLWIPLGMEFDGSWSLDSEDYGFEKMESGINGRAIDFAKFGRLYLNQGSWDGVQIIPQEWVEVSTTPDPARLDPRYYVDEFGQHVFEAAEGGFYKYMWYGLLRNGEENDFYALGKHGQFIYVSPFKQLIIVRFGEGTGIESLDWIEIFYQFATNLPVDLWENQTSSDSRLN